MLSGGNRWKDGMCGVPSQIISCNNEDSSSSAENVVTCSQKVGDFERALFWCAILQWNCDPVRDAQAAQDPFVFPYRWSMKKLARWWRLFITHHLMHSESHITKWGVQEFCNLGGDLDIGFDQVPVWWFVTFVVSPSLSIFSINLTVWVSIMTMASSSTL